MNNLLQLLAELAPLCAILGFLFIVIKIGVSASIRKIMCFHLMGISALAFICYMIRYSIMDRDMLTFFTGSLWIFIGVFNFTEWRILKNRDNSSQ